MRTDFSRSLILWIALAAAARVGMLLVTGFTADDAFITYRYAANIAGGNGFVYNPGEAVQGTSTPLFTLILAALGSLLGPAQIPVAAHCLGLLADCCSLVMVWKLAGPLGNTARFLGCALFALYPRLVFCASLGMETPLVVALMLLSSLLLAEGRWAGGGIVLGLLIVMRADSALWAIVLLGVTAWSKRRVPGAALLWAGGITGAWLIYARIVFGTVIPNVVRAKSLSWSHMFGTFEPLRILSGYFPFHGLRAAGLPVQIVMSLLLMVPVLALLAWLYRTRSAHIVYPLFFICYNAVFAAGRVIMADWYYPPALAAYIVTVACAWAWLALRTRRTVVIARCAAGIRALAVPALALMLVAGIARWRVDPGEWFHREPVRLGEWLKENASQGSSVLLEPIGYVGWVSGLYVHDEVGLVSPRVLDYRARFGDSDRWFLRYIRDARPTYVVLQAREIRENRLFLGHGDGIFADSVERAWFSSAYAEVAFPPPAGNDSTYAYNLYQIRDDRRP